MTFTLIFWPDSVSNLHNFSHSCIIKKYWLTKHSVPLQIKQINLLSWNVGQFSVEKSTHKTFFFVFIANDQHIYFCLFLHQGLALNFRRIFLLLFRFISCCVVFVVYNFNFEGFMGPTCLLCNNRYLKAAFKLNDLMI